MKNKKNSQYSNQFKLKIALETLREEKTLSQIASEHNILPQNVPNWRKLLLESAEELFGRSHELEYKKRLKKKDDEIEDLHTKIGKLVVEKDWLQKKKVSNLDSNHKKKLLEDTSTFSIRKQCELLGLSRVSIYYTPVPMPEDNLRILEEIALNYPREPWYGCRPYLNAYRRMVSRSAEIEREST